MVRVVLILALLMPFGAAAQGRLCDGLAQLVVAAADRFEPLPLGVRMVPGSIEERRGTTSGQNGPPRGEYIAIMARGPAHAAREHFDRLHREVQACLPGRQASSGGAAGGSQLLWQLERALIRLLLESETGDAQRAMVVLTVTERW